jgi:hypothetical protein
VGSGRSLLVCTVVRGVRPSVRPSVRPGSSGRRELLTLARTVAVRFYTAAAAVLYCPDFKIYGCEPERERLLPDIPALFFHGLRSQVRTIVGRKPRCRPCTHSRSATKHLFVGAN